MKFHKITPYLWFNNEAKEAAEFYCSIFNNSKINSLSDMLIEFELDGVNLLHLMVGHNSSLTKPFRSMFFAKIKKKLIIYGTH